MKNWRDRDKNGGGLIEFLRKGYITKRLKDYETQICETICSEFTVSKKQWSALVCIGHPLIIILSFSLKN